VYIPTMPSTDRKNVVLDAETSENLRLIAEHLHADAERGRSQAIRYAAALAVQTLGLGGRKKARASKKEG
jgi:hypothetical protein